MTYRLLRIMLPATLTLLIWNGVSVAAEVREGIVVGTAPNRVAVTDSAGQSMQTWQVAPHASISLNGSRVQLKHLNAGDYAVMTTRQAGRRANVVVRIEAHSP